MQNHCLQNVYHVLKDRLGLRCIVYCNRHKSETGFNRKHLVDDPVSVFIEVPVNLQCWYFPLRNIILLHW